MYKIGHRAAASVRVLLLFIISNENETLSPLQHEQPALYSTVTSAPLTASHSLHTTTETEMPRHHKDHRANKRTVLITDSIMRHVKDENNALGIGHTVQLSHKTTMKQLKDQRILNQLTSNPPDYLYIHLGINDIHQHDSALNITHYLYDFLKSSLNFPNTTIIISFPLQNGKPTQHEQISLLRQHLTNLLRNFRALPEFHSRLYWNYNSNMHDRRTGRYQDKNMFNFPDDKLHLSDKGKHTILGNFRHVIHDLTRKVNSISPP